MIIRTAWTILFVLMTSIASIAPAAAEQPGDADVVILFDQSGSMGKHDPKLASKAWLMTFIKTFAAPYKINVVGFDESIHEHLVVNTSNADDVAALAHAVDAITARGLTTDLEMPFRYLLEHSPPSTKLALIVTDGEPEIWDAKLGYLSKRVQMDPAYDGLNQTYRDLKEAGMSQKELFEQLGHFFHTRNIDLIEGHMLPLSKSLGDKLIIWDLSGTSYYLRTWAKAAGAQYLPLRVAAHENPAEHLRQAMLDLQRKSSALINENLPADHEGRAEAVLTTIPEIGPRPGEAPPQNGPSINGPLKNIQDSDPKEPPTKVAAPKGLPTLPPLAQPTKTESTLSSAPDSLPGILLWLLLWLLLALGGLTGAAYIFGWRPRRTAILPAAPAIAPQPTIPDDDQTMDITSQFIAETVKNTLDDAEKLRRRLLVDESEAIDQDRRFSLRVAVPTGAMEIYWIGTDGAERHGAATDISMHGVQFETSQFDAASITRVVCPRMGITLNVTQSTIIRQNTRQAVATLKQFESNLDDWMRWVEIVTRIDQKAAEEE